jgi:hypothetical protein
VVVERFNVDCFGIRSYFLVLLLPLCCIYARKTVGIAVASQVGLLRDSSFDVLNVGMSLSWLRIELMPSVGIVLN